MQTLDLAEVLQKKFIGIDELRRQLSDVLDRLPKEGGELVVTQHGMPQAVLIDLESYLNLYETLSDLQKPGFIESVYKGLREIDEGKGISHEQLKKNLGI
ncbi:MAG: type II toxin-antitoxin system prevent-host-death family antitoxin [Candidatus Daviesbacteria bacterium]|nr:type II toxin-antitoxin system prevent-host-death family antitoxin [Candidatus Daviesbacteria bacterium]